MNDSLLDAPGRPYPAFRKVDLPRDQAEGVTAWDFEVGHGQFRAVHDPSRTRGHDWFLARRQADSGEWFSAVPDLPSREAALVEAESLIELEERRMARRRAADVEIAFPVGSVVELTYPTAEFPVGTRGRVERHVNGLIETRLLEPRPPQFWLAARPSIWRLVEETAQ